VDLRNVYSDAEVARHGFRYVGVGRPGSGSARPRAAAAE
jgi:hypothetical protein